MNKIDYEKYWDTTSAHSEHPSVRLRNNFILNQLKKIKFNSLLDIGCGDGYLLNLININFPGKKLYGADISAKVINLNSSKYKEIEFFPMDISKENIEIKDNFDIVVCSEVIEHLEHWEIALQNLYLLVDHRGFLVLTTQSGKRYKGDIINGHLQHFELDFLEKKIKDLNLNPVISYKKGFPFYNMQKWLFEKNEKVALDFQRGSKGTSFTGKIVFNFTYFFFLISPRSKKIGPQIFILAEKNGN